MRGWAMEAWGAWRRVSSTPWPHSVFPPSGMATFILCKGELWICVD
jgi:hypothetical protein